MDYTLLLTQLENYNSCLVEYQQLTEEKIAAITQYNPHQLDELLRREQAFLMKIKSLEAKRLKLFAQEGLADCRLSSFLQNSPTEYYARAKAASTKMKALVSQLKANNTCIHDLLELRLYKLHSIMQSDTVLSLHANA